MMPNSASKPSIDNLSALQSELNPASQKTDETQNAEAAANDVLGDITLLEEAFAEMEVSVADYEQEIPMVDNTVETEPPANHIEVPLSTLEPDDPSIPVLDKQPSEIIENNQTEMPEDLATHSENIPTLETDSKIEHIAISSNAIDENNAISESSDHVEVLIGEPAEQNVQSTDAPEPEPETDTDVITLDASDIAMESLMASLDTPDEAENTVPTLTSTAECSSPENSVISEPTEITVDDSIDTPDSITELPKTAEIDEESFSSLIDELDSASELSIAQTSDPISIINDETFSGDLPSIEEKIAQATADSDLSALSEIALTDQDQIITELAPDLPENEVASEVVSSPKSPSMSIPFELHSQLSKKIDDLVLDATLSLTSELQTQLSVQLESLLSNAVEAVLPKLVDQMANELRAEVKGRVQQQLPIIVSEVLGKTRLS